MQSRDFNESGTARILVVDDVGELRRAYARQLRVQGIEVLEVETVAEAVRLMGRQSFDLLVLDYEMPDLSGSDALDAIFAQRADQAILLMSGTIDTDRVDEVRAQVAGVIYKPMTTEELLTQIHAILGGEI